MSNNAATIVLPPVQAKLYAAVLHREDVKIEEIYAAMRDPAAVPQHTSVRDQQMWLGPYLTKLNRRLKNYGLRIVPGQLKGTYRLIRPAK